MENIPNATPTHPSENKNKLILLAILAVLIVVLLGVLYFVKQKNLGEITNEDISSSQVTKKYAPTMDELIKLTTAPENSAENAKPNPELTATLTAPLEKIHEKPDKELVDALTAPVKQ
jgi:type IV secretory pathway VirB10-like protein